MVSEPVKSLDLQDPFADCSIFSLFPRTFGAVTNHHHTSKEADTIDYRHSILKSMALRSPQKLLEQANMVVKASSSILNSNLSVLTQGNKRKDCADAAITEENARGRRPGLGIKRERARFAFTPTLSQTTEKSDTTLNIDKVAMEIGNLQDPEEYFLAHKRLEIAKKEFQRQRGDVLTELNQSLPQTAALPRQRRPGIFGSRRTTGRFKELYSQMRFENDEAFISSQSSQYILEQNIPSSPNTTHKENIIPDGASLEREFSSPVSRSENKVNELFNELISRNPEDLEGDKGVALLQEHLQIKPISIDKLCLPDLHGIPKIDFKVSGGNLLNPRNSLVNVHATLKGISSQTPVRPIEEAESNGDIIASPTPPKSAFAAISLLKKRISQLNPSNDPFSDLGTDLSPVRNPSPVGSTHVQSDNAEVDKNLIILPNLDSILQEYDSIDCNTGPCHVVADDSTFPVDVYVNEHSSVHVVGKVGHLKGVHGCSDANPRGSTGDETIIDDESRNCAIYLNDSTSTHNNVDNSAADMQDPVASAQPVIHGEHPILENCNNSLKRSDQQSPAAVEESVRDGKSNNLADGPDQHIETIQERPGTSFDESQGVTHPPQSLDLVTKPATSIHTERKRKEISRRQSLAAAGTKWESGVRRSTRIKMRPLEYWKGERFLYGRIHKSLATVIGVKCYSPTKDNGGPSLKVKSYVSDEYEELVHLAALH